MKIIRNSWLLTQQALKEAECFSDDEKIKVLTRFIRTNTLN